MALYNLVLKLCKNFHIPLCLTEICLPLVCKTKHHEIVNIIGFFCSKCNVMIFIFITYCLNDNYVNYDIARGSRQGAVITRFLLQVVTISASLLKKSILCKMRVIFHKIDIWQSSAYTFHRFFYFQVKTSIDGCYWYCKHT